MYFLLQLSTHLTASLVFCLVIHIKFFRDKPVSVHSLRSTTPSSPHNKKKEKKRVKKWNKMRKLQHCTHPRSAWKSGCIGNLSVTWTHHMSSLGLWVIFYLSTTKAPASPHTYRQGNFSDWSYHLSMPATVICAKTGTITFFCSAAQVFNRCDWKLKLTLDE